MLKYKKLEKQELRIHYEMVKSLYSQLSKRSGEPSLERLEAVIEADHVLLGALDGDRLVGIGSLYILKMPKVTKCLIEDIVVDESARGKGVGRSITTKLIEEAKKIDANYVDLTSKRARVASHKLYQSLGFEERESNIYRLHFKGY
ncbi:MAG: GNAT family N-acetyltransferase [bacterium]|nr:GNAT family N-acetyltransferase [bacterium]